MMLSKQQIAPHQNFLIAAGEGNLTKMKMLLKKEREININYIGDVSIGEKREQFRHCALSKESSSLSPWGELGVTSVLAAICDTGYLYQYDSESVQHQIGFSLESFKLLLKYAKNIDARATYELDIFSSLKV